MTSVRVPEDGVVERLRTFHRHNETMTFYDTDTTNPDGPEAADTIEALLRDNAEGAKRIADLREAARLAEMCLANDVTAALEVETLTKLRAALKDIGDTQVVFSDEGEG